MESADRILRVESPDQLRDQWLAWGRSLTVEQRLAEGWKLSQRLFAIRSASPRADDNRLVKLPWPHG